MNSAGDKILFIQQPFVLYFPYTIQHFKVIIAEVEGSLQVRVTLLTFRGPCIVTYSYAKTN